ncbi:MAG: hypothetical protein HOH58_10445 [Opitutaceae bacterium]|mgnify:CR=1 FL=1|jgi:hypothetical protein|nr:hypothetical protein [Opitutaceae bacterium]
MRTCSKLISILVLSVGPVSLWAQEDTSDRTRVVSDNLAAALADTMPKYNPPPPKPKKTEEELAYGKPKNGIVRLPQVVVEGRRPPIFSERQVNTDKGLQQIAVKRYFSGAAQALNKKHIPIIGQSNEAVAMQMWEEDERLRLITEFNDRADTLEALGDEEKSDEAREMIQDLTARQSYLPAPSALHRDTKGN